MKYTLEQIESFDCIKQGKSLKIKARAGSGKTTTAIGIVQTQIERRKRGLYCAFNTDVIANAKRKIPESTGCVSRTFHSLAYKDFGWNFKDRLSMRLTGSAIANTLSINGFFLSQDSLGHFVTPTKIGSFALSAVQRFCSTMDTAIGPRHCFIKDEDLPGIGPIDKKALEEEILGYARKLWPLMSDIKGNFPSSPCIYAKLYADSRPKLKFDYIIFDEAQDADPLMLDVVQAQSDHAQLIWIGDPYQQIYSWRGAVNAMDTLTSDITLNLTQSFRFGASIAHLASQVLKYQFDEDKSILGTSQIPSEITRLNRAKAILCRTNAQAAFELFELPHTDNVAMTGLDEAKEFYTQYDRLEKGEPAYGTYSLFKNAGEIEEYAGSSAGSDLKPYLKIIKTHPINKILARLETVKNATKVHASDVDVIISTAHKAKGLEYETVRLAGDFRTPSDERSIDPRRPTPPTDEQMRLLYVAITRASHKLDVSALDWKFLNGVKLTNTQPRPENKKIEPEKKYDVKPDKFKGQLQLDYWEN